MKIAKIIRRLNFDEWGGSESALWHLSQAFVQSGNQVTVVATRALGGEVAENLAGVEVRRFPYRYPYWPLLPLAKAALDRKGGNPWCPAMEKFLKAGDFSIIHNYNLGRLAELGTRAAKKLHIPNVITLHGGFLGVPEAEKRELLLPLKNTLSYGGIVDRLLGRRYRDVLAQMDGIICVGEDELEPLRLVYPDKKVVFLPNGVSVGHFDPPPAFDWRKELQLSPDTELILNVSRIDYQKNQKMLIKMLDVLQQRGENCHLLLIGPVTVQYYYRELLELIAAKNLQKRVTIVPGMRPDDERLRSAYLQCDLFVIASRHEPFGIVVLEAWAGGAPVLAANVGGLGRLVSHEQTGIKFDRKSLDSLLEAYAQRPHRGDQICQNARREVEQKYDWSQVASQLLDFYRELGAK